MHPFRSSLNICVFPVLQIGEISHSTRIHWEHSPERKLPCCKREDVETKVCRLRAGKTIVAAATAVPVPFPPLRRRERGEPAFEHRSEKAPAHPVKDEFGGCLHAFHASGQSGIQDHAQQNENILGEWIHSPPFLVGELGEFSQFQVQ